MEKITLCGGNFSLGKIMPKGRNFCPGTSCIRERILEGGNFFQEKNCAVVREFSLGRGAGGGDFCQGKIIAYGGKFCQRKICLREGIFKSTPYVRNFCQGKIMP